MLHIKFYSKNRRYCNLKSLVANNHSSACYSWEGTTEANAHNFCPENKVTTDDYGRITIKIP